MTRYLAGQKAHIFLSRHSLYSVYGIHRVQLYRAKRYRAKQRYRDTVYIYAYIYVYYVINERLVNQLCLCKTVWNLEALFFVLGSLIDIDIDSWPWSPCESDVATRYSNTKQKRFFSRKCLIILVQVCLLWV